MADLGISLRSIRQPSIATLGTDPIKLLEQIKMVVEHSHMIDGGEPKES